MRRLALGLLIAIAALAQPGGEKGLLLPHQVRFSGIVVDADGNSILEATVAHANLRTHAVETDAGGKFTIDTNAPTVTIEKPGYRSQRITTSDAAGVRITLARLSESFPMCEETTSRTGLDGLRGGLYFRAIAGIRATPPVTDVDYVARNYSILVGRKKYSVLYGAGPMWGGGEPRDELVWKSVQFEQRNYEVGTVDLIDAQGTMPDGTRWRQLGEWGASASYENVPPEAAATLDKLLDSACWKPSARK
jgi:hypothetical protein